MSDKITKFPAKPRTTFTRTNTNDIMSMEFDPIRWVVDGYVPEGFSVLAGRQKLGKTWLAIDMAVAVASGGVAMGSIGVETGNVLYVDCENGQRRIQRRIDTIWPMSSTRPDLSRLEWVTDAPTLDKGFIDALEDWRQSVRDPRLVVIDVLQRIKPAGSASRTAYENDYSIWSPLQKWATEHGIAVIGLHHTKKGGADDPLESLSGSNGLSACADTTLVLDMKTGDRTLYVRGRDIEEKEIALAFDGGLWSIKGDASEVRRTHERSAILDALEEADEPMSPGEIAVAAEMKRNNVDRLLGKMVKEGEVMKAGRGRYVHPDRKELLTDAETENPGKIGKKVRSECQAPSDGNEVLINQRVVEAMPPDDPSPDEPNLTDLTVLTGGDDGKKSSETDWLTRAQAITCKAGDGPRKVLTPEGDALFREMLDAGVAFAEMGRVLGITRQSAHERAQAIRAAAGAAPDTAGPEPERAAAQMADDFEPPAFLRRDLDHGGGDA